MGIENHVPKVRFETFDRGLAHFDKLDEDNIRLVSYLKTYHALVRHFQKGIKTSEGLIVAAHAAYGWMPTTLRVHNGKDELDNAFKAFQRLVKDESDSEEADLKALIAVFNNSIVGISKMLHFAAPERFAIWDSKVAAACGYTFNGTRRQNAKAYLRYVEQLQDFVSKSQFTATYESVKRQISEMGIETEKPLLSRLRVGEMLLFASQSQPANS